MKKMSMDLLRILNGHSPCTAKNLASLLHVSVRTIKTYVAEINAEHEGTILSKNDGYHLSRLDVLDLTTSIDAKFPETSNERVIFIINRLLRNPNDSSHNIEDLSDTLFVSVSTLRKDLLKVARRFSDFDLELNQSNNQIRVVGLEKNKRKLISAILYEETSNNFINLDYIQRSFHNIDIPTIKEILFKSFEQDHWYINDYSLLNLILHITITIDRIQNNNANTQMSNHAEVSKLQEFGLAQRITDQISEVFHVLFNESEVSEMALLIASRATNIDYMSVNETNIDNFIDAQTLDLVNKLISDIRTTYYIDLKEPEFLFRFSLHIKNLLKRAENNYFSKNPLAFDVKTSCPLIYDISISLAQTILETSNVLINDDEIAYIAFHIGSALQMQQNLSSKITSILFCPNYYDLKSRIVEHIHAHFFNDLLVTNIVTDEEEIEKTNGDLVLTTIPLSKPSSMAILNISPFINEKDKINLTNLISHLRKEKRKALFKSRLESLITPMLFERQTTFQNENECIAYMSERLVSLGLCNLGFPDELLQREKLSTTAYEDFAIPHSMKMNSNKTGISVLISDSPIPWGGHQVSLVLMMFFNQNDRFIFNEIYEPITMIMTEPDNIQKLIATHNHADFIQTLVDRL